MKQQIIIAIIAVLFVVMQVSESNTAMEQTITVIR